MFEFLLLSRVLMSGGRQRLVPHCPRCFCRKFSGSFPSIHSAELWRLFHARGRHLHINADHEQSIYWHEPLAGLHCLELLPKTETRARDVLSCGCRDEANKNNNNNNNNGGSVELRIRYCSCYCYCHHLNTVLRAT